MQGASSREGFNLFLPQGRVHFVKHGGLFSADVRRYIPQDTFGRFICGVLGHATMFWIGDDLVCYRCFGVVKVEARP